MKFGTGNIVLTFEYSIGIGSEMGIDTSLKSSMYQ